MVKRITLEIRENQVYGYTYDVFSPNEALVIKQWFVELISKEVCKTCTLKGKRCKVIPKPDGTCPSYEKAKRRATPLVNH